MPKTESNPAEYFQNFWKSREALASYRTETPKYFSEVKELIHLGQDEAAFALLDVLQRLVNTLCTATLDCLERNNELKLARAVTNRDEAETYYRAALRVGEVGLAEQVLAGIDANNQWMALSIEDLEV